MGGLAEGGFALDDVQTWFIGSTMHFAWGDWQGSAAAYFGITDGAVIGDSLFRDLGQLYSTSFSFGIQREDIFSPSDRLSFFFTQPSAH